MSDPARGYGLLECGGMSVGKYNYCAFILGDLCSLQSWVPLWHAAFLTAASEVAAISGIHKVIPKPPLGNLCLKECLQDFEGIQNFEKQVLGSD